MRDEDIALLYWLQHLLGGKIIPVKDKKAYRIVFLQGNCELFTIVQHLNGKLHHPNKIKGLAQMCTKFGISLCKHPRLSLQTLGKNNPSYFNAYVRGIFDADGSIYLKNARHTTFLESSSASQYWLSRHTTAKLLRIEISIVGELYTISEIRQSLGLTLLKDGNKKQNRTVSTGFRLMANQPNPNMNSNFTTIYSTITNNIDFLPLTVKSIRLKMVESFSCLNRPFFYKHSKFVHEECINGLLVWLIWPIAHKNMLYEKHKKRINSSFLNNK